MMGYQSMLVGLAVLLSSAGVATAQETPTALDVRRTLDARRDEAEPIWRSGDPRGVEMLESIWEYLGSPGIADLARGSDDIRTRVQNLAVETACGYALLADTAAALDNVKRIYEWGGSSFFDGFIAQRCPTLAELSDLPPYRQVRRLWRSENRRWSSTALSTPYRKVLPQDERVAGLSLLWSRLKVTLPGFQTSPGLDLDSLYLAYLPKVRRATRTFDYYRVLIRFVAELGDAHTNVIFPEELAPRAYARPPLVTGRVEGRTIILDVLSPELSDRGLAAGMEIVAIDEEPVDAYVKREVAPYISSSTPQDRDVRTYRYALLAGDAYRPVRLTVAASPSGPAREFDVPRSGYDSIRSIPTMRDTTLEGGIGYLRIDGFDTDELRTYVPDALRRLGDTRGLIIDVRYNGGGDSSHGYRLLSHLSDAPVRTSRYWVREFVGLRRARGGEPLTVIDPGWEWPGGADPQYDGPVILLISAMTFSAAEDFVVAFDAMDRGLLVGEATGGSTGQPFSFALPGGGWAQVRSRHDTYPDGTEFIGVGVQPDIVVRPTLAGFRAGRDEALEAAIRELLSEPGD